VIKLERTDQVSNQSGTAGGPCQAGPSISVWLSPRGREHNTADRVSHD